MQWQTGAKPDGRFPIFQPGSQGRQAAREIPAKGQRRGRRLGTSEERCIGQRVVCAKALTLHFAWCVGSEEAQWGEGEERRFQGVVEQAGEALLVEKLGFSFSTTVNISPERPGRGKGGIHLATDGGSSWGRGEQWAGSWCSEAGPHGICRWTGCGEETDGQGGGSEPLGSGQTYQGETGVDGR